MFLAVAALTWAASSVWRCYDEVYDLALYRGKVVAATSGGVLVESRDHTFVPLGDGGPAPCRKVIIGSEIEAADRVGRVYRYSAGMWSATAAIQPLESVGLPTPSVSFGGRDLTSRWGAKFLVDSAGAAVIPRDPADGDYDLIARRENLFAATNYGLYQYSNGRWIRERLPSEIPVLRPQAIAFGGPAAVVGGLGGLYLKRGNAKDWQKVSGEPIRDVLHADGCVWVLYGSGAIDKLDLAKDQLTYDVLNGGAKRPWASCLSAFDGVVLFGGQGGWIERSRKGISEHYYPEFDKDVVMAATGRGPVRWIGTQKTGLLRYGQGAVKVWNPGDGLPDTWVTALLHTPQGLFVATSGSGLFLVKGDEIRPVESPTQRPRRLALYKGSVVVGGMDGAWIRSGASWRALDTNGEETTSIVSGRRLVVCTASGVYFFG